MSSKITIPHDWALLSWGCLDACLSMGSSEWFPSFVLPVYTAFVIDIIFLRNFYTFTLPILFILSGGLARGRGLVGLSYKWGLNHNILWVKRTKQGVEHNLALTTDPQVKQNGFRRTIILWGKNKLPKKSPKNGRLDFCFIQSSF